MSGPDLVFSREMEPFDYLMFRGESEPRSRSSMLSVSLLDTSPGIEPLRAAFDRFSRVVLRLRQRVVVPALPVAPAEWVIDPDFDLTFHVRRVRAPAPGGLREVLDLATSMLADPLDTARPLWEALLVEDIDAHGARAALIMKVSHCVTDGVGAMQLLEHLYDFERAADRGPLPPVPVPEDRSPTDLVRTALRRAPVRGVANAGNRLHGVFGRGVGAVRDPGGTVHGARRMAGSLQRVLRPPSTPPSPLLQRRGVGRHLETVALPFAELRGAAKAAGCSVNDAYVAAVCGALRLYHEHLGVPVDSLPLAIPISIRTADDPAGGNRFSGARLSAPVGVADPVERMRRIHEIVLDVVDEPATRAFDAVAPVISRLPAPVLGTLASTTPGTDVHASNVRGYATTPYVAGAEILETYWFGPLLDVAVMIVLLSQAGTCYLGVHYDSAAVSDRDLFARCLREGFDEVLAVAPKPPAKRAAAPRASVPRSSVTGAEAKAR